MLDKKGELTQNVTEVTDVFKIGVPKNFVIFTGEHLGWSLFLLKRDTTQVFSCEYCEIFENRLFYRTPPVDAFG